MPNSQGAVAQVGSVASKIATYNASLDAALIAWMNGESQPFERHLDAFDLRGKWPSHELARQGAIHKLVTSRTTLPMVLRSRAKEWLLEHSFSSHDDGDVPCPRVKSPQPPSLAMFR